MGVDHYENFPVASVLCPPALRPAVTAIYRFARTADDLADEGEASNAQRLADLAEFRVDLMSVFGGNAPGPRWREVFVDLATQRRAHALPLPHLSDLLSAFEQDVHNPTYRSRAELLDYCARSANPIGRLLLHLYGVNDDTSLRQSDAICTALQLINFWQDLGVDLPRQRCYVPMEDLARHGLHQHDWLNATHRSHIVAMVRELCLWTCDLMACGAPLATRLPGRAGWELRLVVQGGLRVLEKIERQGFDTLARRPAITALDAPRLLWRALRMPSDKQTPAA